MLESRDLKVELGDCTLYMFRNEIFGECFKYFRMAEAYEAGLAIREMLDVMGSMAYINDNQASQIYVLFTKFYLLYVAEGGQGSLQRKRNRANGVEIYGINLSHDTRTKLDGLYEKTIDYAWVRVAKPVLVGVLKYMIKLLYDALAYNQQMRQLLLHLSVEEEDEPCCSILLLCFGRPATNRPVLYTASMMTSE